MHATLPRMKQISVLGFSLEECAWWLWCWNSLASTSMKITWMKMPWGRSWSISCGLGNGEKLGTYMILSYNLKLASCITRDGDKLGNTSLLLISRYLFNQSRLRCQMNKQPHIWSLHNLLGTTVAPPWYTMSMRVVIYSKAIHKEKVTLYVGSQQLSTYPHPKHSNLHGFPRWILDSTWSLRKSSLLLSRSA